MSTYLELVNNVLTRLNEVNLDSTTFASARGIHQAAVLGVRNAVYQINSQKWEWPFNYANTTQVLTAGINLYSVPVDYKVADWESFYIENDTIGDISQLTQRLEPIQRQKWYKWHRQKDLDAGATGISVPKLVFWYGNGQFGVTPSPNAAYTVNYNYWKQTPVLADFDDTILVPENYNWVVEIGALESMYIFLDNDQRASISGISFRDAIQQMALALLPQNISDMRDTRVNFGGGQHWAGYAHANTPFVF